MFNYILIRTINLPNYDNNLPNYDNLPKDLSKSFSAAQAEGSRYAELMLD